MIKKEIPDYRKKVYQLLDVKGEKFAYAVLKNKDKIETAFQTYLDILQKYKPSEKYNEYDEKRVKLAEKFAKKDEKGEPIIIGERYDVEDKEGFEKEWDVLKEEYKEALKEWDDELEKKNQELDEEIDIDFHIVSKVPDTISARELEAAEFMIKK